MVEFKDLFSKDSANYSRFRPTYPQELYAHLAGLTSKHTRAWDCGTGNGQAAIELAAYFDAVIATDPSEKQLAAARRHPKIEYRRASAESSGLEAESIDLITVAQAFHWFKHERFFEEARRVGARSGSVLAVWSYALLKLRPDLDRLLTHYYTKTVGPFWEPERRHVDEGYRGIAFPFPELELPRFEMRADWDREQLLGYLGTWSATQAAARALGRDPLAELRDAIFKLWPEGETKTASFDFTARAFRIY